MRRILLYSTLAAAVVALAIFFLRRPSSAFEPRTANSAVQAPETLQSEATSSVSADAERTTAAPAGPPLQPGMLPPQGRMARPASAATGPNRSRDATQAGSTPLNEQGDEGREETTNRQGGGTLSGPVAAAGAPAAPGSSTAGPTDPAIPAQDTYVPPANLVYEIEAGMRAPVALLPHDKPMSPQVAGALESIRLDFDREISAAADPAEVWDQARERADNAYRKMFGFEAFNQLSMQDAREALEARKASQ